MSKPFGKVVPATTKVLIRTNEEGTCVIDEGVEANRKGAPRGAPRRTTRSKHALDDDPLPVSPRRKRSRYSALCTPQVRILSKLQRLQQRFLRQDRNSVGVAIGP